MLWLDRLFVYCCNKMLKGFRCLNAMAACLFVHCILIYVKSSSKLLLAMVCGWKRSSLLIMATYTLNKTYHCVHPHDNFLFTKIGSNT
jgi:hypothetical protein